MIHYPEEKRTGDTVIDSLEIDALIVKPKFCSRKCARCVDARCVGGEKCGKTTQTALCRSLRTRSGRSKAKP